MDRTVICRPFASSTSQGPPVTEHDALSGARDAQAPSCGACDPQAPLPAGKSIVIITRCGPEPKFRMPLTSRLPVSNGSPRRYKLRALPDELRRSRHPVPTRIACLTGARSQPCVTASLPLMASNHEPPGPEPDALPIELSGIVVFRRRPRTRTGKRHVLSVSALPISVSHPCAARGSNSRRPGLRVQRSATELAARGADKENRTPISSSEGADP